MRIERILAGIDLGPDTGSILAYASFFAKATSASLHLLSVLEYLVTPPVYLTPYMEEEKKITEEKLRVWEEKLATYGISAVNKIIVGRLSESFVAAVERARADLLVLGFRPHTFRRSSSEGLVKDLQMPVLVVRGEKAESAGIGSLQLKRMICPTDFSETSMKAFRTARALAELFSSELTVLHVVPSHFEEGVDRRVYGDMARQELLARVKVELDSLLKDSGIEDSGVIKYGDPCQEIGSCSVEQDADLVVIGANGLSVKKAALIGSVADAVLKSSPCPVLVVH